MFELFTAQFVSIYLLGIQQQNVIGKHYLLAFVTSFVLGIIGWYITSVISIHNIQATGTLVWWVFIIAGPFGIITAMKTHPYLVVKFYRKVK